MTDFYDPNHRLLQAQFASQPLADRLEDLIVRDELDERAESFIAARDFFFLSTVDQQGFPTVSYKGGAIGMVKVVDSRSLLFPCYDGNGMWLSAGNIQGQGRVGMLFIDFENPDRLRVQGTARLSRDPDVLATWPEVGLAVAVEITRVWMNCPRYIHQMVRARDAPHVPRKGEQTPVPEWKNMEVFADVLPPAPYQIEHE